MAEENISQELRLKNIDETRDYLIEKMKQIELKSKNYIKHLLILASTVTRRHTRSGRRPLKVF